MNATALRLLDDGAQEVETLLRAALPAADAAPARLHQAMHHAVFAGGKRVRPLLAKWSCMACGAAPDRAIPAMQAVEFLHTYTLVHDDLPAMDDDRLRRGQPTVHIAFDEATAILAGDALQCLAFACLAPLGGEAVRSLATAAGSEGVIGGQQDDLDAEGSGSTDASLLDRIHARKTAALIAASCELGAIAAAAPGEQRRALHAFGTQIGLAFQLVDDILDVTAETEALGKTPGKDVASGKLTWVGLHGLEATRARAAELHHDAVSLLAPLGKSAEPLRQLAHFLLERSH